MAPFTGFGTPPGVSEGDEFPSRMALRAAGVHAHTQPGIYGRKEEGAKSIVLSGGYRDDEDYGDVIVYTGQGGRGPRGKQIADQDPEEQGNTALITSMLTGIPVRVSRGSKHKSDYSPESGYRYGGLYRVEDHWLERGVDGFIVCRYRLVKESALQEDVAARAGSVKPARRAVTIQRIVRSGAVVERVKSIHDHTCQFCGRRLSAHGRGYSEGAHIRPLGRPHDGPDVESNVLCLCANCHVLFDLGAITVDGAFRVYVDGKPERPLRMVPGHTPSHEYFEYHRSIHPPGK